MNFIVHRTDEDSELDIDTELSDGHQRKRSDHSEYVVDDVLPVNEISLMGGPSGSGKTTLMLQIIDDIQNEREVFRKSSHPRRYVYISCDRSRDSIDRTLERLDLAGKIEPIIALPQLSRHNALERLLDEIPDGTELVFVEGFGLLVPDGEANDYYTVAKFLSGSVKLCKQRGITILGTVHTSKTRARDLIFNRRERILGSVAWAAYSETIIFVEPADQLNVKNVDRRVFVLPRNAPSEYFDYCFDEGGRLVLAIERLRREFLNEKFDPLSEKAEITRQEILAWAHEGGMSDRTAEYWITDAISNGELMKKKRGVYIKLGPALNHG